DVGFDLAGGGRRAVVVVLRREHGDVRVLGLHLRVEAGDARVGGADAGVHVDDGHRALAADLGGQGVRGELAAAGVVAGDVGDGDGRVARRGVDEDDLHARLRDPRQLRV